jgi:hypothetical protein
MVGCRRRWDQVDGPKAPRRRLKAQADTLLKMGDLLFASLERLQEVERQR